MHDYIYSVVHAQMNAWLIVVALIVIALIYVLRADPDVKRRASAHALIDASGGDADAPAKEALENINAIARPQPDDYFQRARLRRFNFERDDAAVAADYLRAVDGYAGAGVLPPAPAEFTAHEAIEYALPRVARGRRRLFGGAVGAIGDDFTMHADGGNNAHIQFDPRAGDIQLEPEEIALQEVLMQTIVQAAAIQTTSTNTALEAAKRAPTRRERVKKYLAASKTHTSDAQNVHDTQVNRDLRATLHKLRAIDTSTNNTEQVYAEITARANALDAAKRAAALRALNTMRNGGLVSTYGETESAILLNTWARADDPRNARNRENIKNAIIAALVDCVEYPAGVGANARAGANAGNLVCANGRAARVMGALATLDVDPTMGRVLTFEAYKNQVYDETRDIFMNTLDSWEARGGAYAQAAADYGGTDDATAHSATASGNATTHNATAQTVQELKNEIKQQIDANLQGYRGKFTPAEYATVQQQCYAFALL